MDYKEELAQRLAKLTKEELIERAVNLLDMSLAIGKRNEIARRLSGEHLDNVGQIKVASDRIIPETAIKALRESPLLDYVPEIIKAALDPRGPHQSYDILLIAAELKGGRAFYITTEGISQSIKNSAGHILSLAGFKRESHYNKERKMPLKAWKIARGQALYTVEQRIDLVFATIHSEYKEEKPITNALARYF